MSKNLKKMISYYKPYRSVFLADMFFAILASVIALAIPLIARYITSSVIYLDKEEVLRQTLLLGAGMVVLVVISCYCNFFISNYGHVMGAKSNTICDRRFSHIFRSCRLLFTITRKLEH